MFRDPSFFYAACLHATDGCILAHTLLHSFLQVCLRAWVPPVMRPLSKKSGRWERGREAARVFSNNSHAL